MDEKRDSDRNKQRLLRFYDEVANDGNLDLIDTFLTEDFVEHEEFPGIPPTREGVKQFFTVLHGAFEGLNFTVDHMLGEGVFVSASARARGTHKGEFMGVPATGRPVDVHVFDLVQFRDGKMCAHWGLFDTMAMMQQLGALPGPPA